jgi:hypothetical protein
MKRVTDIPAMMTSTVESLLPPSRQPPDRPQAIGLGRADG